MAAVCKLLNLLSLQCSDETNVTTFELSIISWMVFHYSYNYIYIIKFTTFVGCNVEAMHVLAVTS